MKDIDQYCKLCENESAIECDDFYKTRVFLDKVHCNMHIFQNDRVEHLTGHRELMAIIPINNCPLCGRKLKED